MSKQPEALRLADALATALKETDDEDNVIHVARWFVDEAAAELRRLHAENDALRALLLRIRQWDTLDTAADGQFWRSQIDAAIDAARSKT